MEEKMARGAGGGGRLFEGGTEGGDIRSARQQATKSSKFTRGTGNRQLAREIYMKMA